MNAPDPPSGRRFHAQIYADLERRLRASNFGGGAAEAHGVICGLACRGADGEKLRAQAAKALHLSSPAAAEAELIDGLRAMVARDLRADGFAFDLLLPGDDARAAQRAAAVADWCGGFMQGFLPDHDSAAALATLPAAVREAFDDIMAISCADEPPAGQPAAVERQLAEIEEYLRVAAQLIFEELNPPAAAESPAPTSATATTTTAATTPPGA